MAIRRRSLRNARNLRGLRSRKRFGGAGSKGSKDSQGSTRKTTKVKANKKKVLSQIPASISHRTKASAVSHRDYVNVIRREYKALADLVQKHIDDSESLKTEFYKLKSQSVYLK